MPKLKWWGYLHVSGTKMLKRYFDPDDPIIAAKSDFVERVIQPFMARDSTEARQILNAEIKRETGK